MVPKRSWIILQGEGRPRRRWKSAGRAVETGGGRGGKWGAVSGEGRVGLALCCGRGASSLAALAAVASVCRPHRGT